MAGRGQRRRCFPRFPRSRDRCIPDSYFTLPGIFARCLYIAEVAGIVGESKEENMCIIFLRGRAFVSFHL